MNKERIYQYDVLRALAIIAVLNIHILGLFISHYSFPGVTYLQRYSDFAVPLFVVLSAALFLENNNDKKFSDYFSDKTKKIFIPYFVVSIGYIFYKLLSNSGGLVENIPDMIILGVIKGLAAPHLYFVPLIMTLYVLYPTLLRLYYKKRGLFLAGTLFVSIISYWFIKNYNIPKADYRWFVTPWIFYCGLGFLMAELRKKQTIYNSSFVGIVSGALFALAVLIRGEKISDYNYLLMTLIIGCVCVFSYFVTFIKNKKFKSGIEYLSNNAFKIYLSHYVFIIFASKLLLNNKVNGFTIFFVYFLSIFGSIALYKPIDISLRHLYPKIND